MGRFLAGAAVFFAAVVSALAHSHSHLRSHFEHQDGPVVGHDGSVPPTFACGVGHPGGEHLFEKEPEVTHVAYDTTDHPAVQAVLDEAAANPDAAEPHVKTLARRLAQNYDTGNNGAFLPLSVAHSSGQSGGIRIKLTWEAIDGGDNQQCGHDGDSVPDLFSGGTYDCGQADLVTADVKSLLVSRTEWAAEFFKTALKIKPVKDSITIADHIVSSFGLTTKTFSDTDLVMIMTARPAKGLNGYALCQQEDQYGRCVVGQFNWVTNVLNLASADDPDAIASQRHTALHEMVHVLGGIGPNKVFIKDDGTRPAFSDLWLVENESADYPKKVTKLKSPKVLQTMREHFGCDTLKGVPIEDQTTGKVAHWEARILGPELMSYGTGTAEVVFGDITFAYFEDTNQYIANYSMGGRLVAGFGDSGKLQQFEVEEKPAADFKPPRENPPGFMAWGYKQGCGFAEDSAAKWSLSHRCEKNRQFGCTPDNRMSAVCTIQATWALPNDKFTCGDCPGNGNDVACVPTCNFPRNSVQLAGGGYGLPQMFQYFDSTTAAAAAKLKSVDPANVGGFSSAMDFAPVRLGYWNCQDTKASANGSSLLANQAGGSFSMSSMLGTSTDNMKLFGGQAYCPDCRCFTSSLIDFSSPNVKAGFPTYGLCYRQNCYKADYLQFAIESQLGGATTWYKCPPNGGKLYIAGFSGAFHCPVATDFCQFERVTGIKYRETDPFMEWVIFGSIGCIPLLIFVCCAFPCFRNFFVGRFKVWCGVNHFNRRGQLDLDGEIDDDEVEELPAKCAGSTLKLVNSAVFLLSLVVFLMTLAALAGSSPSIGLFFLIPLTLSTCFFSLMGLYAGTKPSRGTSCVAVIYTYIVFFASVFYIFAVLYALTYPKALGKVLDKQWPVIRDSMPEGVLPKSLGDKDASEVLAENAGMVSVFYLLLGIFLASQLIAAIKVITVRVLAATMFTICNYALLFVGIALWGAAGYLGSLGGSIAEVKDAVGGFVFGGFYFLLTSILSLVAGQKKTTRWLSLAMFTTCISFLFAAIASGLLFVAQNNIDAILGKVSDEDLAQATQTLGLQNGSRADIAEGIKNNLRTMGLLCVCMMMVMICMLVSNAIFLHHVRMHFNRVGTGGGATAASKPTAGPKGGEVW